MCSCPGNYDIGSEYSHFNSSPRGVADFNYIRYSVYMSKLNILEIEQGIGNEEDHLVYRVPKRHHDLTAQLCKEFSHITKNYGVVHLVFQLNNRGHQWKVSPTSPRPYMLPKMKRYGWKYCSTEIVSTKRRFIQR